MISNSYCRHQHSSHPGSRTCPHLSVQFHQASICQTNIFYGPICNFLAQLRHDIPPIFLARTSNPNYKNPCLQVRWPYYAPVLTGLRIGLADSLFSTRDDFFSQSAGISLQESEPSLLPLVYALDAELKIRTWI